MRCVIGSRPYRVFVLSNSTWPGPWGHAAKFAFQLRSPRRSGGQLLPRAGEFSFWPARSLRFLISRLESGTKWQLGNIFLRDRRRECRGFCLNFFFRDCLGSRESGTLCLVNFDKILVLHFYLVIYLSTWIWSWTSTVCLWNYVVWLNLGVIV